jgi:hypothetical protein
MHTHTKHLKIIVEEWKQNRSPQDNDQCVLHPSFDVTLQKQQDHRNCVALSSYEESHRRSRGLF